MLRILILILFVCFAYGNDIEAQSDSQESEIVAKVDLLFDAMRANDSSSIVGLFTPDATLASIFTNSNNKVVKRSSPASKFITAIGMPHEAMWDERIWSHHVQIDGPMAYVWTDYSFYLDNVLTHCGVNVFEMMNTEYGWQISSVTDTRRTDDCRAEPITEIHDLMDKWHHAAAVADEYVFFNSMEPGGIYIGTDISERWTREEMFDLYGQYFEKESAWDFKPIERNIELSDDEQTAWFDEKLDTWMGDCRGSGVVRRDDDGWKISHYHLSIAVPNDKVNDYLKLIGKERK